MFEERIAQLMGTLYAASDLRRVVRVLRKLGDPQLSFPIIHVAGTNGKGSVCAMLEHMARVQGMSRVGLFTSPHLIHPTERIQINRCAIAPNRLCEWVERVEVMDRSLSAFEMLTICAMLYFKESAVDLAIIECGIGGALDSTNVPARRLASVITSIGLDHCELLGCELESIAVHKGGIIYQGVPVIVGTMPPPALETLKAIAQEKEAPFHAIDPARIQPTKPLYKGLNGATAQKTAQILGFSAAAIEKGMADYIWPGRWQVFERQPNKRLIIDCAHNEEAIARLEPSIKSLAEEGPLTILFASTHVDRVHPMAVVIERYASRCILAQPPGARCLDIEHLRSFFSKAFLGRVEEGLAQDIDHEGTTLVIGSVYLARAVLKKLQQIRCPDGNLPTGLR